MGSKILSVSLVLAAFGASSQAACTDSLFLQSIPVFRQSLKNSATLGTWDSVKVNPWDPTDLLKAAPLGYPKSLDEDTATHYLGFRIGCGADTNSAVQGTWVMTKRVRSGEEYRHQTRSESFTKDAGVIMQDGDGAGQSLNGEIFNI